MITTTSMHYHWWWFAHYNVIIILSHNFNWDVQNGWFNSIHIVINLVPWSYLIIPSHLILVDLHFPIQYGLFIVFPRISPELLTHGLQQSLPQPSCLSIGLIAMFIGFHKSEGSNLHKSRRLINVVQHYIIIITLLSSSTSIAIAINQCQPNDAIVC